MQTVKFYKGEEKHVKLLIHASGNVSFTIREAEYELSLCGVVESNGTCIINEHIVDALIAPLILSTYILKITYQIADETLIEQIEVVVQ